MQFSVKNLKITFNHKHIPNANFRYHNFYLHKLNDPIHRHKSKKVGK